MATEGSEGEIVVKGGSVKLTFDGTLYQKVNGGDPKVRKHDDRKITRVKVEDENDQVMYDSGEGNENPLRWTITISTKG